MKLVTFKCQGSTSFGMLREGEIIDLTALAPDLISMSSVGVPDPTVNSKRFCLSQVELLPPIPNPGKIVCVGLNYRSHLALLDDPVPEVPILFTKPNTSLIGSGGAIVLPPVTTQVDFEGELAVVIGKKGKYISESAALSYVAGYTCANDVSAHDIEFRTSQWTSGKMLDTFCPLGPVLVTADEIANPNALRLRTVLNGEIMQDESTSDMLFPVAKLISYISSLATLDPGDLILTGTPAGLGCMRHPPMFLKPGDAISVEIEGIGKLANPVIAEARCAI
jgi:2-keto-4-pentenoate hydratase/2-oxohepta-3-ene-1,7-dioic acid hydratase in catechol pathway